MSEFSNLVSWTINAHAYIKIDSTYEEQYCYKTSEGEPGYYYKIKARLGCRSKLEKGLAGLLLQDKGQAGLWLH